MDDSVYYTYTLIYKLSNTLMGDEQLQRRLTKQKVIEVEIH